MTENTLTDMTFEVAGVAADIDEAFDAAVSAAVDRHGEVHPITTVYVDDAATVDQVGTIVEATAAVRAAIAGGAAFAAAPYAERRFWSFRKVNVKIADPDLDLGVEGTLVGPLPLALDADMVQSLLGSVEGGTPADGERVEQVELTRLRSRYRPVNSRNVGKLVKTFEARVVGTGVTLAVAEKAAEARREAIAIAKAGPVDGEERYSIEVVAVQRRESGPLYQVDRVRVAQSGAVRVTLVTEKDPAKTKVAGWVFAGTTAPSTAPDEDVIDTDDPTAVA